MTKTIITHSPDDSLSSGEYTAQAEAFGRIKFFVTNTMNKHGLSNHKAEVDIRKEDKRVSVTGFAYSSDDSQSSDEYKFPKDHTPTPVEQILALFFGERAAMDETIKEHYEAELQGILKTV